MKKTNLIINVVLLVAVAVLYVLHFTSGKSETSVAGAESALSDSLQNSGVIAYVDIDTLLNKYDLFFDMKKQFGEKQKRLEADMAGKSKAYEKSVIDFQDKVQKGLLTRSQAEQVQQQLMGEQQNLLQYRDKLTMQLGEEEQVMNRQLINEIEVYLKEFNKDGRYQYILSNTFGGNLLYKPEGLNITEEVLKGLNESYVAKRAAEKK